MTAPGHHAPPRAAPAWMQPIERGWVRTIGLVIASLWVLDLGGNLGGIARHEALRRWCDLAREDGVGSFVAIAQLVLVAALAWGVRALPAHRAHPGRAGWTLVAVFFTYLAVDDGSRLHERVGTAFRDAVIHADSWFAGWPTYAWQLLFVPMLGTAGVAALGFLAWRAPWADRARIAGAAGLQVLAVALDALEGTDPGPGGWLHWLGATWPLPPLADAIDQHPTALVVHLLRGMEETGEILSFTLLATVLLRAAARAWPPPASTALSAG